MTENLRNSGLECVGDVAWGTHFCLFYDTARALLDSSVPFLKAGLASNEQCMWIVPEAVCIADAWSALELAIPDAKAHLERGALSLIPSRNWYFESGKLRLDKLAQLWKDTLSHALDQGYQGLRVTGGTLWLSDGEWQDFCAYEEALNESIGEQRMTVLCTYSLPASRAADVLDVARSHQFATCKRNGVWEMVESSVLRQAKEEIRQLNADLERRVVERTRALEATSRALRQEIQVRERAEAALVKNERQFHALFDEATLGIVLLDPNGGPSEVNHSMEQITGYSGEELGSMTNEQVIDLLAHPEDRLRLRQSFAELKEGKLQHYRGEARYIRKDGGLLWGDVSASLVRDEAGTPQFGFGMFEDISERKQAEELLRKTESELAHVGRVLAMGELAASIAHEVNQPLTAIRADAHASLRWLDRQPANLAEAVDAIQRVVHNSRRAAEVIQHVKQLVKNTEPYKVALNLNEVIVEVLSLCGRELQRHGVCARVDLLAQLPNVLGDRVQLQQVLLNLIMNGAEAMTARAEGGDVPQELVVRSYWPGPDFVRVQVRDAGSGLADGAASKLFEAFYTTKAQGMGMGLSIGRRIIEAHGGRLWASANQGPGMTFEFELPVENASLSSSG